MSSPFQDKSILKRYIALGARVHHIHRKVDALHIHGSIQQVVDSLRTTGAILREGRKPFCTRSWPSLAARVENLAHDIHTAAEEASKAVPQ